jgi:TrmH family RNA methyltransferase
MSKMIAISKKKLILSLAQKKHRDKTGLFVAEGPKLVNDLLKTGLEPEMIFTTDNTQINTSTPVNNIDLVDKKELHKISFQKTPQSVLAVFNKPKTAFTPDDMASQLTLCLDGIQDPGNLGTILRLADWFGIQSITCSFDTADIYNPKVVQASMGAIGRVQVQYTHLPDFCREWSEKYQLPVFGTFMDGQNIYETTLPPKGLIIMGNEGVGIRPETQKMVTRKISIPNFSSKKGMESLNVGVATAIVCAEFRRQNTIH